MFYFCMRENFSLSIVKQQHHGWSPPGKVGVPLVTRIPYPTLFHTISFPCAQSENSSRESKPINVEKVLFLLAALIPALIFGGKKQKSSWTPDNKKVSKKPKRLRHQKNHLSHPSVIEKSIKRVQNKDVRKSQRKSWNQIVFFTSSDVISAKNVRSPYRQTF